ncbi:MAG TPA: dethiobiotin synthase [Abditibacteriaceae bacterium]|jgi:dethiobiotin synthetase
MAQTIFIAGTDTGVGKTLVSALVALCLAKSGVRVVATKPLASGCEEREGVLVADDAEFLKRVTRSQETLAATNPLRWREPLAPLVCARRESVSSAHVIAQTAAMIKDMASRYDIVVVEGVGGLLAPIGESDGVIWTNCELAALCDETILVARRNLGTINHTTLTTRVARDFGLKLRGLIFCDAAPIEEDDIAAQTSPEICAEMTGLPILGEVHYLRSLDERTLQTVAHTLAL